MEEDNEMNESEMNIPEKKITLSTNSEIPKRITCRQDFTQYFGKSDNSVNKIYRTEVNFHH